MSNLMKFMMAVIAIAFLMFLNANGLAKNLFETGRKVSAAPQQRVAV